MIYYSTGECDHNWSDWTKDNEQTHSRSCSACGESETRSHSYNGGVLSPDEKNIIFTCSDCEHTKQIEVSTMIPGDFNGDGSVNNADVIHLLWHTLFPDKYVVATNADFVNDGSVNNDDVIYLLWHTLFPENYPLH